MSNTLPAGLYVSCQASAGSPLRDSDVLALLARCAELGGAVGIRAEGLDDIAAVRRITDLPLIGLVKRGASGVYITPTLDDVEQIIAAGADVVAVDATLRDRPDGVSSADFLRAAVERFDAPILADVDSVDAAIAAEACGVAFVSTTLAGYTGGEVPDGPDLDLVSAVAAAVGIPVLAEGRYHYPEQAAEAIARGAHAVVVGGAITDPVAITRRFVDTMGGAR